MKCFFQPCVLAVMENGARPLYVGGEENAHYSFQHVRETIIQSTWLYLLCLIALLTSCRTNDIAKHSLREQVILYRTTVASDAADAHTHISSPSTYADAQLFTDIGAGIASAEAQSKLLSAINPDSLAMALSTGVQEILHTYFRSRSANSPADTPAYIAEIELTTYRLHSGEYGVYARVTGTAKIFQARSARLLWENCESVDIPLQRTYGAGWANRVAGAATSIANAAELMSISSEELRAILLRAAAEAGRDIGQQLREDAAGYYGFDIHTAPYHRAVRGIGDRGAAHTEE